MDTHKMKKWIYGSILIIIYSGFFAWQQSIHLGALLLVAVTMGWAWIFYKATGIDLGLFSEDKEK